MVQRDKDKRRSNTAGGESGSGQLLQYMLDGQARTKSELADLTGWARSTVSARVDELTAVGLLGQAGTATSTGGRPPARLIFNPLAGFVLAMDLGVTHLSVAVTDLAANVLEVRHREIDVAHGPVGVLDQCLADAEELLESQGYDPARLVGLGMGVPGPVEHSTGRPINPPIMPGWDRFDIPEYVQRRYSVPVFVDNDVNILALGEHAVSWPEIDDLLFVKVSTGIGGGIILGGVLQRGAKGSAGDIGHLRVPFSPDSPRPIDDQRDLEDIAGGVAIAKYLNTVGVVAASTKDVVEHLRLGNEVAVGAVRQAGREIGEVLANIVNLLNPSVIVIGGSLVRAGEHLLAGIREVVYGRSIPLATQELSIVQSSAGVSAGVVGAATMVIQQVLAGNSVDSVFVGLGDSTTGS